MPTRTLSAILLLVVVSVSRADLKTDIDAELAAAWKWAGVTPSGPVDDATFLRRVSLDVVGRIPTVAEARAFLADDKPGKRERLVNRLLGSGAHGRHAATTWRRAWVPQLDTPQFEGLSDDYERWLAARLTEGVPLDRLAAMQLTVDLGARRDPKVGPIVNGSFLLASEMKPENLAANTARAFLGVNLDCAQCHDHPFARWTRDQFWRTAAFFTDKHELAIPQTTRTVSAVHLDGTMPTWSAEAGRDAGRAVLAKWVTARDNPYFAKNAANRVWASLMGTGLVEPLDDISGENKPSHPALLDVLAKALAEADFDPKVIIRAIVLSRAYGLSAPAKGADARLYAGVAARGLTGEQLHDSLRTAAGLPVERDDLDPTGALRARKSFAARFRVERPAEARRSILQALSLMNGELTAELTNPEKSPTLVAVVDAPFLDDGGRVEALFLAALGRKPTTEESSAMLRHVAASGDRKMALADVFWALLNGSEFNTNH